MKHPPPFIPRAIFSSAILIIFSALLSPGPVSALTLAELIDAGLRRNLTLHRTQIQIDTARIAQRKAHNALVPNLDAQITDSQKTVLDNTQKSSPFLFNVNKLYSLNLSQKLEGLGKVPRFKEELAGLQTRAAEILEKRASLMVVREIVTSYFGLMREAGKMQIHDENLRLLGQLMEVARINQQVGLALANDILRIEVQQARTSNLLNKAKYARENHKIDLAALLNQLGSETQEISFPATPSFSIASLSQEASLETMMARDDELKLSQNDCTIYTRTIQAAKGAMLPTLDFNTNYTFGKKVGPMKNTSDYTITFGLNFPVFDSGDLREDLKHAENLRSEVELAHADLINRKKANLLKQLNEYREVVSRIGLADKAMEQSRENMRVAMTRYQNGAASVIELVDAQLTLSNSGEEAIDAHADERLRLADLFFSMNDLEAVKHLDQGAHP